MPFIHPAMSVFETKCHYGVTRLVRKSSPRSLPKVKPFLSCWFLGAAQAEQCLGVCSVSPAFRAGCPLRGLWVKLRDHLYYLPISFRTETCVSSWCHIMSRSSPLSRALFGLSLPALPGWARSCTCSTGRDCSRELFLGTALLCSGLLWDPAASVCVECPSSKTQAQREGSFGICMYSTKVGKVWTSVQTSSSKFPGCGPRPAGKHGAVFGLGDVSQVVRHWHLIAWCNLILGNML